MDKKYLYVIGAIVAIGILSIMWFVGTYNSLIRMDQTVDEKWAQVENQYQRRADLIPNLIETVRGARDFERETQTQIAELRSQAGQAKLNVQNAKNPAALQATGAQMDSILSRLLVIVERYPDLKATQNFLALQSQLEGTENRIAVERMRYNEVVREYNIKIKRIPTVFIANMFGYRENAYFEVEEGKEQVPQVEF